MNQFSNAYARSVQTLWNHSEMLADVKYVMFLGPGLLKNYKFLILYKEESSINHQALNQFQTHILGLSRPLWYHSEMLADVRYVMFLGHGLLKII